MNFANFSEVHVRVCIHVLLHEFILWQRHYIKGTYIKNKFTKKSCLTHFKPVLHFCTPLTTSENFRLFDVLVGIKIEQWMKWVKMFLQNRKENIDNTGLNAFSISATNANYELVCCCRFRKMITCLRLRLEKTNSQKNRRITNEYRLGFPRLNVQGIEHLLQLMLLIQNFFVYSLTSHSDFCSMQFYSK